MFECNEYDSIGYTSTKSIRFNNKCYNCLANRSTWLDSRWKFSERMAAQILYWFMLIGIRTIILFIAFYFFVLSSYCLAKKS